MSFPKALELRMSGLRIAAGALLLAGCGALTPDAAVSADAMPVADSRVETIREPDADWNTATDVETVFDSVAFVRLSNEPEALLSGIDEVIANDTLLIVRDLYGTKCIKLFSRATGAYLGTVGRPGRGPGEYLQPTHMQATADGRIVVWDQFMQRISSYDMSGRFLRSADVPWFCMKFHEFSDGGLLLHSINSSNSGCRKIGDFTLFECDTAMRPVRFGLPRKKDSYWSYFHDHNFFTLRDTLYHHPVYCDTIYAVGPDRSIEAKFAFDFGRRRVPERLRRGRHRREVRREEAGERYIFMNGDFFLTDTHLLFGCLRANHNLDCLYSLETGRITVIAGRTGFFPLPFLNPVGSTDRAFIGHIFPAFLAPGLAAFDREHYDDAVEQFGRGRADLIFAMQEDDNPILTFFYPKR